MHLRSSITLVLALIAVAAVLAATSYLAYQARRGQLGARIRTKVDRLVLQPPEGISELEWAVHVYWTHNLHCEAIPQVYASVSSLQDLDRFLDDAIAHGPDFKTIDILWDRYAAMSRSGREYREKWKPVRDEIADAVAREGDDYGDAGSYRDFLESVRSENATHR